MTPQAGALIVLVCPECGKRYKGDPSKPEARYQCPADQSTLIRLDSAAELALRKRKDDEYAAQNFARSLPVEQDAPDSRQDDSPPPGTPQEDLKTRLSRGNAGAGKVAAAAAPAPA